MGNHPIVVFSPSLDLVCQFTLPIIHTRHRTCAAARVRLLARALRLTHACAQHGTQHGTLSNGEVCARFLCLVRLPEVEKRMPQPSWSQANGWSPVCVRLCAVMLPDSEKRLPQPSWSQAYGRSPVRTRVDREVARLREALAAALVAAGVRPLARVRARVDLECGVGGEGHCAPVDLAVLWEVAADWARNEFSISDMYTCLPYANTSTTPAATHWNKTGQLNTATGHALSQPGMCRKKQVGCEYVR